MFKNYELEIVEYINKGLTTVFIVNGTEDIVSQTFTTNLKNEFIEAIKKLYYELKSRKPKGLLTE